MLPIRRILAPTDFSPRSLPALDLAVELAHHFSAELVVTHVLTPMPTGLPSAASQMPLNVQVYRDTLLKDTEQALQELVRDRIPGDVETETVVAWGPPPQTIVDMADEKSVDLVVICTRGATGLSRFVSGSVTEKVVRLSDVPVLTVQAEDEEE
jgi:nucleotide-binding universal stress UspA family protein